MTAFDLLTTMTTTAAFLSFIIGLPKFFLTFKKTFSLGEGCLVLQAILTYLVLIL
jgi:hypothetical protein